MTKAFTFIGGDDRQREALRMMSKEGFDIRVYGLDCDNVEGQVEEYSKLSPELFNCDVLMLPIPYNNIEGYITMDKDKYGAQKVSIVQVMDHVDPSTLLILGKADERLKLLAQEKSVKYYDILGQEAFSILNSIPTAEGAIQAAMESSHETIHGSKALVLGYGRIGKCLSRMLKGIGANVSVGARKSEDLSWIKEGGYRPVHISNLIKVLPDQQLIFNTIPHLILDRNRLEKMSRDVIVIDLASHPGGTDFEAASELGIKARLDLGLPGKVAPVTAGRIIMEITCDLLRINLENNKS
ncbi:MAG TPA: dipicolinate synthase subunit DpsA [Bacillota bacterium]|nr:dipicolinate synthase subunit DpsA [Bacillota bacterium]